VVTWGRTISEPFSSTSPRPWLIATSSAPATSQLKTLVSPGSIVGGDATKRTTANSLGPLSLSMTPQATEAPAKTMTAEIRRVRRERVIQASPSRKTLSG
jgi:hypothetical protein